MNLLALLRRAAWLVGAPLVMAGVAACNSTQATRLFRVECQGTTLELQKVIKKTFSNAFYSTQIVFGNKAPIVLDLSAMGRSLPYDKGVYGQSPFHDFALKPHTYSYAGRTLQKLQTMIYVDPQSFSPAEFEALTRCLKLHSDELSKAIDGEAELQQFQIVGAVYGNHDDFVERFHKNPKDWYEVYPDGRVGRVQLDAMGMKGMREESIGGVSNVKAPRTIYITDDKKASVSMLKAYKNPHGQTLPERFHVLTEPRKPATD